jgi:hypothetical protein
VVEFNGIRGNGASSMGAGVFDDLTDTIYRYNEIVGNGTGFWTPQEGGGISGLYAIAEGNLVANNAALQWAGGMEVFEARGNTVVGNGGGGVQGGRVRYNIVVGNDGIGILGPGDGGVACNDSWANSAEDYWFGGEVDTTALGNLSLDPLFCDPLSGEYTLRSDSPCAPGEACGLIGAYPVGCAPVPTRPTTWGRLKARFE